VPYQKQAEEIARHMDLLSDFSRNAQWGEISEFLVNHPDHAALLFMDMLAARLRDIDDYRRTSISVVQEIHCIIIEVRREDPELTDKLLALDPFLPQWLKIF
jgi:hypothetical protein